MDFALCLNNLPKTGLQILHDDEALLVHRKNIQSKYQAIAELNINRDLTINSIQKNDHSACGVGFVVDTKGQASHDIVNKALDLVCCYEHRGGWKGPDKAKVGDGAGIQLDIPYEFIREEILDDTKGKVDVGPNFGLGMFFLSQYDDLRELQIQVIQRALTKFDFKVLAVRKVPVNITYLGTETIEKMPYIAQFVLNKPETLIDLNKQFLEYKNQNQDWYSIKGKKLLHEFETKERHYDSKLYLAYNYMHDICNDENFIEPPYIVSLSASTVVYKGMLTSGQLVSCFPDLSDFRVKAQAAIVHTRFSTNTAPQWELAHPYWYLAHNGEINSSYGSAKHMQSVWDEIGFEKQFPLNKADSGQLDHAVRFLLSEASEYQFNIEEVFNILMPPSWERDPELSDDAKALHNFNALHHKPWDGPALVMFRHGFRIGAALDASGLRPNKWILTDDGLFIFGSESNRLGVDWKNIKKTGRIAAGQKIVINLARGEIYENEQLINKLANRRKIDGKSLVEWTQGSINVLSEIPHAGTNYGKIGNLTISQMQASLGWHEETRSVSLLHMLQTGSVKTAAMGSDFVLPVLSKHTWTLADFFRQNFVEVTAPPKDVPNELLDMSTVVFLGGNQYFNKRPKLVVKNGLLPYGGFDHIEAQENFKVAHIDTTFSINCSDLEKSLEVAIRRVQNKAAEMIEDGIQLVVLNDMSISKNRAAIPDILAISAVNSHLERRCLRQKASLGVQFGQVKNIHHLALMFAYGADVVEPTLMYKEVERVFFENYEKFQGINFEDALRNVHKAATDALLVVMGKVGFHRLRVYSGAEQFFAIGLDIHVRREPILAEVFDHTYSKIGGFGLKHIAKAVVDIHKRGFDMEPNADLIHMGQNQMHQNGEKHNFSPEFIKAYKNYEQSQHFAIIKATYIDCDGLDKYKNYFFCDGNSKQFALTELIPRNFYEQLKQEILKIDGLNEDIEDIPLLYKYIKDPRGQNYSIRDLKPSDDLFIFLKKLIAVNAKDAFTEEEILNGYRLDFRDKLGNKLDQQRKLDDTFINSWVTSSAWQEFSDFVSLDLKERDPKTFSDLLIISDDQINEINIDEVESNSSLLKRLNSGAMSLGALTPDAHLDIARAMQRIGASSNTGEGGEPAERWNSIVENATIKQVASGRNGVSAEYLSNAMCIEIKVAQGAKPGEGGQMPAAKVDELLATLRNSTPGVGLTSPATHHDIYSIEDLEQLIYDLKSFSVRIRVKLAAKPGVGTIACGVAKAGADEITIVDATGGTGAAKEHAINNTGGTFEEAALEVTTLLYESGLRDSVKLIGAAGISNERDMLIIGLLGFDGFEIGTAAMQGVGCIMLRRCGTDCDVGVATEPHKYRGNHENLMRDMLNRISGLRKLMAKIGVKRFEDLHQIFADPHQKIIDIRDDIPHLQDIQTKLKVNLLFKRPDPRFYRVSTTKPGDIHYRKYFEFKSGIEEVVNGKKDKFIIETSLSNHDRSFGAVAAAIVSGVFQHPFKNPVHGKRIPKHDALDIRTTGDAGQSLFAFNTHGMKSTHSGTFQDGIGKCASGGAITVSFPVDFSGLAHENVLGGNCGFYGASDGIHCISGRVGDRFGVMLQGATLIVEGVGKHCGEFIKTGTILNLSTCGQNMGAGAKGGIILQYGSKEDLKVKLSKSVQAFSLSEKPEYTDILEQLLKVHIERTSSALAISLLANLDDILANFTVLIPTELQAIVDKDVKAREKLEIIQRVLTNNKNGGEAMHVFVKTALKKLSSSNLDNKVSL